MSSLQSTVSPTKRPSRQRQQPAQDGEDTAPAAAGMNSSRSSFASKRVHAAQPSAEGKTKRTKAKSVANSGLVQTTLSFAPQRATAPNASTASDIVADVATDVSMGVSSSSTVPRRSSPRKPAATASAAAFLRRPAAVADSASHPATSSTSSRRKSTSKKRRAAEDEEDDATAAASPSAAPSRSKRRKTVASNADIDAASSSTAVAAADASAVSNALPDEFLRRSGRTRTSVSYKEKDEHDIEAPNEEEVKDDHRACVASSSTPAATAADSTVDSFDSAPRSPKKSSRPSVHPVDPTIRPPLFTPPSILSFYASQSGSAPASAPSVHARRYNLLLSLRAREMSYASGRRMDGGLLPVRCVAPPANAHATHATNRTVRDIIDGGHTAAQRRITHDDTDVDHRDADGAPMELDASAMVVAAPSSPPSSSSSANISVCISSLPTLFHCSFGPAWLPDQRGLSSLPRALINRTTAPRRDPRELGLPLVVRNRFDVGSGGGLTPAQFKAYTTDVAASGELVALGGHGGVVKLFVRSAAGEQEQESVCEDSSQIVSPFEADYAPPSATFVAHARWISRVKFLNSKTARLTGGTPFVTSSDDSYLKLWSAESVIVKEQTEQR
jgi:hypothetical protein